MISMELTAQGAIAMIQDDAVDLRQFGEIEVTRASHVEFCAGPKECGGGYADGGVARGWFVQSAKTLRVLAAGLQTRAEALAWEKEFYSPSGRGWAELTGGKS